MTETDNNTKDQQWYNNRQLFEMMQGLGEKVTELFHQLDLMSLELEQTRNIVTKYNGLRETIEVCQDEIEQLKAKSEERKEVGKSIREWGGWLIAIASFLFAILTKL